MYVLGIDVGTQGARADRGHSGTGGRGRQRRLADGASGRAGVRIAFSEARDGLTGWALARLSVTEPLITLRYEAHSDAELAEMQARVRAASETLDGVMGG